MPSNNAPIIFLLGTSTAGKSTIIDEVERQSKGTKLEGEIEIWGHDKEMIESYKDLGEKMFGGDERFQKITQAFPDKYEVLNAIYGDPLHDKDSGKKLSLKDGEFEQSINGFLQDTEDRYSPDLISFLRDICKEEKARDMPFKIEADRLYKDGDQITKNAIDRAISYSKNGKAVILDGVPLGFMKKYEIDDATDYRIVEKLDEYLKEKEFSGPTQVALVHVHPAEMAARMEKRNEEALARGGDIHNLRDDIRYFSQYSQLYGKQSEDGIPLGLQEIKRDDFRLIAEKFGSKDGVKIRDMKDLEMAEQKNVAIEEISKTMCDAIGFEDADVLRVGSKVRADFVFDHQQQKTSEIAGQIFGFISSNMPAKEVEDAIFAEKSWVDIVSQNRAGGDSMIKR